MKIFSCSEAAPSWKPRRCGRLVGAFRSVALRGMLVALSLPLASACVPLTAMEPQIPQDEWQKPLEVLRALDLKKGDRVVDLGSGGGYFTFLLADAVGPDGKVYAIDVNALLNRRVEWRASYRGFRNVEVIRAWRDDPRIPEKVDVVFLSNTYHHLIRRVNYFRNLRRCLNPDGRVISVDFHRRTPARAFSSHAISRRTVLSEMSRAGYRLTGEHTFLPRQDFFVFQPL